MFTNWKKCRYYCIIFIRTIFYVPHISFVCKGLLLLYLDFGNSIMTRKIFVRTSYVYTNNVSFFVFIHYCEMWGSLWMKRQLFHPINHVSWRCWILLPLVFTSKVRAALIVQKNYYLPHLCMFVLEWFVHTALELTLKHSFTVNREIP